MNVNESEAGDFDLQVRIYVGQTDELISQFSHDVQAAAGNAQRSPTGSKRYKKAQDAYWRLDAARRGLAGPQAEAIWYRTTVNQRNGDYLMSLLDELTHSLATRGEGQESSS